jgi:hypothetical protein
MGRAIFGWDDCGIGPCLVGGTMVWGKIMENNVWLKKKKKAGKNNLGLTSTLVG